MNEEHETVREYKIYLKVLDLSFRPQFTASSKNSETQVLTEYLYIFN